MTRHTFCRESSLTHKLRAQERYHTIGGNI